MSKVKLILACFVALFICTAFTTDADAYWRRRVWGPVYRPVVVAPRVVAPVYRPVYRPYYAPSVYVGPSYYGGGSVHVSPGSVYVGW
jgi:hypothetical protein